MRHTALWLLSRIGHRRGSSLRIASALVDTLDSAAAVDDGCSTSSGWSSHGTYAGYASQSSRAARRYNFIQPVDTQHINELLESATRVEHAAIPVLRYGAWFDPEQVTRTLQRLPRMVRYQRRKGTRAAADNAAVTSWRLLDALGTRLAQVAPDCTDEQLTRALWAYGVSRRAHGEVISAAYTQLLRRLSSLSLTQLATTAWSLAAATSTAPKAVQEPVREALQVIARHLVATRPATLSPAPAVPPLAAAAKDGSSSAAPAAAASSSGVTPAADVVAAAVAADRAALAADQPWMDHRSAVKLAVAFAALRVREPQALDVIGDAAAARIDSQLQAHDRSSGPLVPRATFWHWTIRGWQAWPRPRPPRSRTGGRPSRYLRDESPRVVLRDFTLPSLAPLLAAFRRLGHRHEPLLRAAAQHVVASAGPSLRVAPADLTRLLGALEALHFRHAPAMATLLGSSRIAALPAPLLVKLTLLAAAWRVPPRQGLYDRLVRQLVARAWIDDGAVGGGEMAGGTAPSMQVRDAWLATEADPAAAAVAAAINDGYDSAEAEAPPQLEPRAKESWERRLPSLTWRTGLEGLGREEEQWAGAHRRAEDVCGAADLAAVLRSLAKVGFKESDPAAPLLSELFVRVWPHLPELPADALADVALAAVQYGPQLDRRSLRVGEQLPSSHLDLIRHTTHAVLYGAVDEKPASDLRRRLLALTGYSGGGATDAEARTAVTAEQAAEIRRQVGLSPRGALRLAKALTQRPEAVAEKELRAALSLLELDSTPRDELGALVQRLRQGGRNAALPPRLLAAVGDALSPPSQ